MWPDQIVEVPTDEALIIILELSFKETSYILFPLIKLAEPFVVIVKSTALFIIVSPPFSVAPLEEVLTTTNLYLPAGIS